MFSMPRVRKLIVALAEPFGVVVAGARAVARLLGGAEQPPGSGLVDETQVDRVRDHRRLLVRGLGLLARHQGRGGSRQRRPHHRDPDPRRRPGPPAEGTGHRRRRGVAQDGPNLELDRGIARMRPEGPEYEVLRRGLQELRGIVSRGGWAAIPAGAPLKVNDRDNAGRLNALRARLAAEGFWGSSVDTVSTPAVDDPRAVELSFRVDAGSRIRATFPGASASPWAGSRKAPRSTMRRSTPAMNH